VAYCDGVVEKNTIIGNSAAGGGVAIGGALAFCDAIIQHNTIFGNSAVNGGGGLSECAGTIRNNTIQNNHAAPWLTAGGGLHFCKGLLQNNRIFANSSHDAGGGLYRCLGVIRGNLIAGNVSGSHGGGLSWCFGLIENNTICGNRGAIWGGGLEFSRGTIRNCIIWGNSAPQDPDLHMCDAPSSSWLTGDPHFADLDGADNDPTTYEDNDYRLSADSPCIDSGMNEDWMWAAVDIDDNPRIWGGGVDMGAYEFGSFPFEITGVVEAGGTQLTWNSRPGDTYTIWSSSDPYAGKKEWSEEETMAAQGETTTWIDPETTSTCKFYRIELK